MFDKFDKEIARDSLERIKSSLELIVERASAVSTPNDFLRFSWRNAHNCITNKPDI